MTEIRGPYYTPLGLHYLDDLLRAHGEYVDTLKFSGGSFVLLPGSVLREIIDLCHRNDVRVSTGGFIERVLVQGDDLVDRYLDTCREVGFDIVEISSGFVRTPVDDLVRLAERVVQMGMAAKPEVGIQFGAGGATEERALEAEGTRSVSLAVEEARHYLDAGAEMIMVESEGVTEQVSRWRMDVPAEMVSALGLERLMFEAADPEAFGWYVKTFGPEVNLFVDHSQIVQLEALRSGLWGTTDLWGRVAGYRGEQR